MTKVLWTDKAVIAAVKGQAGAQVGAQLSGVSIDSRTVGKDEIFIAIKGDNFDGHAFVGKALDAGAGAAIVETGFDKTALSEAQQQKCITVPDALEAMNDLGRAARARCKGKVVAVTGSVGKTGSKEMLRLALSPSGKVHASEKSFNNHWGVPLSLALMPEDSDFDVAEIGMNHPGEIIPLTAMVRPHVAIVTTVEPVHLGFFKDVEEIAHAKAEIFSGLEPGGIAILNRDNAFFELLKQAAQKVGAKIISFGLHPSSDIWLKNLQAERDGSWVQTRFLGKDMTFKIGAPGKHMAMNALAVLAACESVGADLDQSMKALEQLTAPVGRGERTIVQHGAKGAFLVIDESYNANPASMRAALDTVGQISRTDYPRRVAVLGDMLELGETSKQLHEDIFASLKQAGVDAVFLCGEDMKALNDVLPLNLHHSWAENSALLEDELMGYIRAGDAVMIKGSLGSKMGRIVNKLKTMDV